MMIWAHNGELVVHWSIVVLHAFISFLFLLVCTLNIVSSMYNHSTFHVHFPPSLCSAFFFPPPPTPSILSVRLDPGWDPSRGFPADLPFAAHDALALYDALFFVLKAKCAKLPATQPPPSAELGTLCWDAGSEG